MLEIVIFLAALNAFLMKLMSKKGLLYKDAKYFKEWFLEIFWRKTPDRLDTMLRCVPCRMFWFCGLPQTFIYYTIYGYSNKEILLPFVIAVLSSFFYVIINPNHEDN